VKKGTVSEFSSRVSVRRFNNTNTDHVYLQLRGTMAVVGHDHEKLQALQHIRRIHIERLLARADRVVVVVVVVPTATVFQERLRYGR